MQYLLENLASNPQPSYCNVAYLKTSSRGHIERFVNFETLTYISASMPYLLENLASLPQSSYCNVANLSTSPRGHIERFRNFEI